MVTFFYQEGTLQIFIKQIRKIPMTCPGSPGDSNPRTHVSRQPVHVFTVLHFEKQTIRLSRARLQVLHLRTGQLVQDLWFQDLRLLAKRGGRQYESSWRRREKNPTQDTSQPGGEDSTRNHDTGVQKLDVSFPLF